MEPETVIETVSLGVSAVAQVLKHGGDKRLVIMSSNGSAAWIDARGALALADLTTRHWGDPAGQ